MVIGSGTACGTRTITPDISWSTPVVADDAHWLGLKRVFRRRSCPIPISPPSLGYLRHAVETRLEIIMPSNRKKTQRRAMTINQDRLGGSHQAKATIRITSTAEATADISPLIRRIPFCSVGNALANIGHNRTLPSLSHPPTAPPPLKGLTPNNQNTASPGRSSQISSRPLEQQQP